MLSGPSFFSNPYSTYASIRASKAPVYDPISDAWMIGRFADVESLLKDLRTTKRISSAERTPFERSVLSHDPPEHSRIRSLFNQAFNHLDLPNLEARVAALTDNLIDGMLRMGRCDFISAFAVPLPLAVICEIMGIPRDDAEQLCVWSSAFVGDDTLATQEADRLRNAAIAGMVDYFSDLVMTRSNGFGVDLISALARARNQDERMSNDELVGNCMLLLIAGHETTVNLLGNGLFLLLTDRSRFERMRRESDMLRPGIEEMLRFESPVQLGTFRVAAEPIEVGGVILAAGAQITLLFGSANRDPEQFPDADSFDLNRAPNRHLAFGHGPHRCLGAALARMEARVAFTRILERLPDLRLDVAPAPQNWIRNRLLSLHLLPAAAVTPSPVWRHNAQTRGLRELIVAF